MIICARAIRANGTRARGLGFIVAKEAVGKYRITFDKKLPRTPIVVTTSDGSGGSDARVRSINTHGFKVEGRRNDTHGLHDVSFNFIVARPS